MSFFNKLFTLAAGTSHDLLDKVIDMNSPTMLRQYARDLETEVEKMNGQTATAEGSVRTTTRERDNTNINITNKLAEGTKLKNGTDPAKDSKMTALAAQIVQLRQTLSIQQQSVDSATAAAAQLNVVYSKLKNRSQEINARIRQLENMDASAKSKASAAAAIDHTAQLLDNTGSSSIDDIESKIRASNDVADAKLNRSMSSFNDANPDPNPEETNSVMSEF